LILEDYIVIPSSEPISMTSNTEVIDRNVYIPALDIEVGGVEQRIATSYIILALLLLFGFLLGFL
jgi:hypothetical protein